jgi:DNA/RNA-binding domain of Phe-tRNA-synthetase-like protein
MKISISPQVFKKFHPKFQVAVLLVTEIQQKKLAESRHLLQEIQKLIQLTRNKETTKNHYLLSPWNLAQMKFGKQATHYDTSVEKLLKKAQKRRSIATRNTLTNLLTYLSLKHVVPLGVDDTQKLDGHVQFKLATGREKVSALQKLRKNALYYHDTKKILGTKLDYWKNRKTKVSSSTTSALIHIDALPPITAVQLQKITKELTTLLQIYCGAIVQSVILHTKKRVATLDR